MTLKETMTTLESLGTAQNRKIFARHGAGENLFGVSFAHLGKLKKTIKIDHALARQLWKTGNTDARTLATMIADPGEMSEQDLEDWLSDLKFHGLVDLFAGNVASRTPHARKKMEVWTRSHEEYTAQAGWNLLSHLAMEDASLPDAFFEKYLKRIEREIHKAKNRAKYGMNNSVIAIGLRNPALESRALAVAASIGKVEVDHGETGCKTPDAASSIGKARERKPSHDRQGVIT